MNNLFNSENKLMTFLSRLYDMVFLNLIFLITCLPVFTIGAALTSMYKIYFQIIKNTDGYLYKTYFATFKKEFKQSTILWLLFFSFFGFLVVDYFLVGKYFVSFSKPIQAFLILLMVILFLFFQFLFPLQSRFENSISGTITNAVKFSIAYLPRSILLALTSFSAFMITVHNTTTLKVLGIFWIMIGFSLFILTYCCILEPVFKRFCPDENL